MDPDLTAAIYGPDYRAPAPDPMADAKPKAEPDWGMALFFAKFAAADLDNADALNCHAGGDHLMIALRDIYRKLAIESAVKLCAALGLTVAPLEGE